LNDGEAQALRPTQLEALTTAASNVARYLSYLGAEAASDSRWYCSYEVDVLDRHLLRSCGSLILKHSLRCHAWPAAWSCREEQAPSVDTSPAASSMRKTDFMKRNPQRR
jgi:hypothetical protein